MKKFFTIFFLLSAAILARALEIDLKPGQLSRYIPIIEKEMPSELRITGEIDARDAAVFSKLPESIRVVDLSETRIVACSLSSSSILGQNTFSDDELPRYSFFGTSYDKILLPSSLKAIGEGALGSTHIVSIEFPESLEEIGAFAFAGCSALESVSLPKGTSSLGEQAFARCPVLQKADFSKSTVAALPDRCFSDCGKLESLSLPSTLTGLGSEVTARTAITSLSVPKVKNAAPYALADMPLLQEIVLPENSILEEGFLFLAPMLRNIKGENVLSEIPPVAFAGTPGVIPSDAALQAFIIGEYAFIGNETDSLLIGANTTEICDGAFSKMPNLRLINVVRCADRIPALHSGAFANVDKSNVTLHVQTGTAYLWKNAPQWQDFNISESIYDSVDDLIDDSGIKVTYHSGRLSVIAVSAIDSVEVTDADGHSLLSGHPGSDVFSWNCDVQGKLLIVRITSGGKTKIVKLL